MVSDIKGLAVSGLILGICLVALIIPLIPHYVTNIETDTVTTTFAVPVPTYRNVVVSVTITSTWPSKFGWPTTATSLMTGTSFYTTMNEEIVRTLSVHSNRATEFVSLSAVLRLNPRFLVIPGILAGMLLFYALFRRRQEPSAAEALPRQTVQAPPSIVSNEEQKILTLIDRLEKLRSEGRVPDKAYKDLSGEYAKRLAELRTRSSQ